MRTLLAFIKDQRGYSLIELSIVLVVISVLIGGVLRGKELIDQACLKSALSQVEDFRRAVYLYQSLYGGLPGDSPNMKQYLGGNLREGDGDGIISGDGLDPTAEAFIFWQHLHAAQLIANPGNSESGNEVTFGHGVPKARVGGGWTITFEPESSLPGHWFRLGEKHGTKNDGPLLTPRQALSLDRQGDDGNPKMGRIQARDGFGTSSGSCITKDGVYNVKNPRKACVIYVQL